MGYMHKCQGCVQRQRESVDISVKLQTSLCYNIYVTLSKYALLCTPLFVTTEVCIMTLQVRYYTVRYYYIYLPFIQES